ncbi:uncharacterized protein si:dkey-282h22.5 [Electrophorus electricus]|uniref:uncharacterized protein si:dkey-282h22.5 n=1 Tax=Electrophorus electricus TaxID=8005 RepID=UPI0015D0464B|nr:uncharacterized protein si:dkey-282h22.5 [Electrophorus electricus]
MTMEIRKALALLTLVSLCAAQKRWSQETLEHRDKANNKVCSNLTQVLDNWKYAIMYQVKDLLVNDYASVLPEYVRIQPLSEALSDLYKQFNTLKENLAKLTEKFDKVETFVDEIQAGKVPKSSLWMVPQHSIIRVGVPSARTPVRASVRVPNAGQWVRRARVRKGPAS